MPTSDALPRKSRTALRRVRFLCAAASIIGASIYLNEGRTAETILFLAFAVFWTVLMVRTRP